MTARWAALFAGAASLTAQTAQPAHQTSFLGTLTTFKMDRLEIGVQPDQGAALSLKVGPETQVIRIPPGERDLTKGTPAAVTDLALGDRVLVSFVEGLTEARRLVLISSTDIARRNAAERLDWQKRGLSGAVASKNGAQVVLEARTPAGAQTTTIAFNEKTRVRRYAPDSVKFSEAEPSSLAELAVGDQVKVRGSRDASGTTVTAEDVVFGTFETKLGTITAIHDGGAQIHIQDLVTSRTLTVRITGESQLKRMPKFQSGSAPGPDSHGPPAGSVSMAQILEQMPVASVADLKVGGAVAVTSTRGAHSDEVTAIMLITNVDGLIMMARLQTGDKGNPMDAILRLHGGMLGGPGGFSLPAMIP